MKHGLGLSQAFRTMTIVPVPGKDAEKASSQLYFYPFVGLCLGALGTAFMYLLTMLAGNAIAVSLVLGALWTCYMAFITRAFHLDGLGDTADGFGGGWTREKRLQIMKDSRTGSFGVVAISLCLLLKMASAAAIIAENRLLMLLWATFVARVQVVLMCVFSSYAKESGLSYDLVSNAGASHVISAAVQTALVGLGLFCLFDVPPSLLLATLASGTALMVILSLVSKRKIGGITGDVLGCCCDICETMSLTICVFLI